MFDITDKIIPACRVIPVVVINDISDTLPTLTALEDSGIPCAEITFRTKCAADAIKLGCESFKDMKIGAGTVINSEQAEIAIDCGAEFIVSPGLSEDVLSVCRKNDIPYIPGCVTPTEIIKAISLGITTVKFFPADIYGGLSAIRALSAPFPQIRFIPTGGVDISNIKDFLSCDKIAAVGGSFITKGNIRENCKKLLEVLK